MIDVDSWYEIYATLRKNPVRTGLTALGVALGIIILLIMIAFGYSLESGVKKGMRGFATNAIFVWGQRTTIPYAGLPQNRQIVYDNGDVEALRKLEGIEYLAPRNQLGGFMGGFNVRFQGKTGGFSVNGDYPDFQHVQTPKMVAGRFLDELDIRDRRKVAVIGQGIVDQLYPRGMNPIGTYIEVSGVFFQVVGVFGTYQTGQNAERTLNTLHIPFTTFQQAFNMGDKLGWFAITGKKGVDAADLEKQIRAILAERHKISPDDDMAIGSFNAGEAFGKMNMLFAAIQLVMWVAGGMTLLAGVVGVMNIMLISVRERTKEIGVRKALGATPFTIVKMIVSESIVLTFVAGYIGMVLGFAAIEAWERVIIPALGEDVPFGPANVGLPIAIAAVCVLVVFGAVAGVMPAYYAARVEPVEALRTE
jgi:putative ABC transport system permease protein